MNSEINPWGKDVKYVMVRRFKKNGERMYPDVDIPVRDLDMMRKNHPDWVVLGPATLSAASDTSFIPPSPTESVPPMPPAAADVGFPFSCPLCTKSYKTEKALNTHKAKAHQ